jgi:hypothetical protein
MHMNFRTFYHVEQEKEHPYALKRITKSSPYFIYFLNFYNYPISHAISNTTCIKKIPYKTIIHIVKYILKCCCWMT